MMVHYRRAGIEIIKLEGLKWNRCPLLFTQNFYIFLIIIIYSLVWENEFEITVEYM